MDQPKAAVTMHTTPPTTQRTIFRERSEVLFGRRNFTPLSGCFNREVPSLGIAKEDGDWDILNVVRLAMEEKVREYCRIEVWLLLSFICGVSYLLIYWCLLVLIERSVSTSISYCMVRLPQIDTRDMEGSSPATSPDHLVSGERQRTCSKIRVSLLYCKASSLTT